jgi:hypothetical protein
MRGGDIGPIRRIIQIPEPERLPEDQPDTLEPPIEQPREPERVPA